MAQKAVYDGNPLDYQRLVEEGYEFNLGAYLRRGREIFMQQIGLFIGFALIATGVYFMAAMALTFIPLLGSLVAAGIMMALLAGFYWGADMIARNYPLEFKDFFKGFEDIVQVTLLVIVQQLIIYVPIVLGMIIAIFYLSEDLALLSDILDYQKDPLQAVTVMSKLSIGIFIGVIPAIYLSISYFFALPLLIFGRLSFWDALETSRRIVQQHWINFFLLSLVIGLINVGGILLLGVGIFATYPLSFCILYAAYEGIVKPEIDHFDDKLDEIGTEPEL